MYNIRRPDAGQSRDLHLLQTNFLLGWMCKKESKYRLFFFEKRIASLAFYLGLPVALTPWVPKVGIASNPLTGEAPASLVCELLEDNWAPCWVPVGEGGAHLESAVRQTQFKSSLCLV